MKRFIAVMIALLLLAVGAVVAVTAAQSKDYSARSQAALDFDIGIDWARSSEEMDEFQAKLDAYVDSHYIDSEGNIHKKTPEPIETPTESPVSFIFRYQYQITTEADKPATP